MPFYQFLIGKVFVLYSIVQFNLVFKLKGKLNGKTALISIIEYIIFFICRRGVGGKGIGAKSCAYVSIICTGFGTDGSVDFAKEMSNNSYFMTVLCNVFTKTNCMWFEKYLLFGHYVYYMHDVLIGMHDWENSTT